MVWGGDVAWPGQGRALGRAAVSDGARKEGREQHWEGGVGVCRSTRSGGQEGKGAGCLSCARCICLFCLSLNLSRLQRAAD